MPSVASPASTPIARTRGSDSRRISAGVMSGYANKRARAAVWRHPAWKKSGTTKSAANAFAVSPDALTAPERTGALARVVTKNASVATQNADAKHAPRAAFMRLDVPAPRTGCA